MAGSYTRPISRNALCLMALIITAILIFPGAGALAKTEHLLTGRTMGTYFKIKFLADSPVSQALWEKKVDIRLKEVNARLSMYQKESEISRFNRLAPDQPFHTSRDFYRVLLQCRDLHLATDGAWDGTVKPLVDLWGFGTKGRPSVLPEPSAIAQALETVGFQKLVLKDHTLTKTAPGITLDLGSIAKGYGVDEIARLFTEASIRNCLVEIGGELAAFGRNKKGDPWTVGVTAPGKKELNPGLYSIVALDNQAIATSGNYRNFFEINGKAYSHIIHPATGFPVDNLVVSATVIADNCTLADGLATALMVMDTTDALSLVNRMENTECLILQQQGEKIVPFRSKGFAGLEKN